ncbi:hypothetical protein F5888DRAFT_1630816 [Russula emetica]|nr:hypothetical protein F5888DRAFT_1630816 [Russula emetica]
MRKCMYSGTPAAILTALTSLSSTLSGAFSRSGSGIIPRSFSLGLSPYCIVHLSLALPSVPHASAALAIPEERKVAQCGPSCEVAKRAQACATSIDCHSSGSVQPFLPAPGIAAPTRGLSYASPTRIRPRRAPLQVSVFRGGLRDQLRRFTLPTTCTPTPAH